MVPSLKFGWGTCDPYHRDGMRGGSVFFRWAGGNNLPVPQDPCGCHDESSSSQFSIQYLPCPLEAGQKRLNGGGVDLSQYFVGLFPLFVWADAVPGCVE